VVPSSSVFVLVVVLSAGIGAVFVCDGVGVGIDTSGVMGSRYAGVVYGGAVFIIVVIGNINGVLAVVVDVVVVNAAVVREVHVVDGVVCGIATDGVVGNFMGCVVMVRVICVIVHVRGFVAGHAAGVVDVGSCVAVTCAVAGAVVVAMVAVVVAVAVDRVCVDVVAGGVAVVDDVVWLCCCLCCCCCR